MSEFSVVSYNLLEVALGSNTIPWVMRLSPEATRAAEAAMGGETWKSFLEGCIRPAYLQHFHSNHSPVWPRRQSSHMRAMWRHPGLRSDADVPQGLRVRVVAEDELEYEEVEKGTGAVLRATTLRGLLRRRIGDDAGVAAFGEIMREEEHVFEWRVRGPRLLRRVLGFDFATGGGGGAGPPPDIVALQEYGAEELMRADYGGGGECAFAEAWDRAGYSGCFVQSPNNSGSAHIAVLWRRDRFRLAADGLPKHLRLRCGESAGGAAFCHDLQSTWHPHGRTGPEALPAKQRRSAAWVQLEEVSAEGCAPPRRLWVVAAHLQTTSRDCAATNRPVPPTPPAASVHLTVPLQVPRGGAGRRAVRAEAPHAAARAAGGTRSAAR